MYVQPTSQLSLLLSQKNKDTVLAGHRDTLGTKQTNTVGSQSVHDSFPIVVVSCDSRFFGQQRTFSTRFKNEKWLVFQLQKNIYSSLSLSESEVLLQLHVKGADAKSTRHRQSG